jgi:cell division protein FtsI/penicillin-binding protein 2
VSERLVALGAIFALLWLVLITRVGFVQTVQSPHYRAIAAGQSVARDVLPPARGEILDRAGVRLAVNVRGEAGGMRAGGRISPNGPLAGQVIGMVGRDGYGQSGLELALDRELRGTDGWRTIRRDAKRRYAPGASDQIQPPVDGYDVRLTIDSRVQSIAELALERGVQRTGAKGGTAIVVDPRTGDLLALANYPLFDPNAKRAAGASNWKDQAIAMVYEPGSTFKIFVAAALLQEGRIHAADTVDGEGGRWQLAGQWIRDTHPLHRITFADAVAHSSNIVFAKVSTRINAESFYKYMRSFGFGMKTGVALPAEESGYLKPVGKWSGRTQQTMAFGHEISTTPLQLAMAFSAIANGGVLLRPRLVSEWTDAQGRTVREEPVREVRRVLAPATAAELRRIMTGVVDHGTAEAIRHPYIEIAGKTGSAQKINSETGRYIEGSYNASFAGMAPAKDPAFVCIVVMDDPQQFKYGGQAAAPVFREILDRMAERRIAGDWGLPPDSIATAQAPAAKPSAATPQVKAASASLRMPGSSQGAAQASAVSEATPARAEAAHRPAPGAAPSMPDLRGAALRDALLRLRALGIEADYAGEGRVRDQSPAPGAPLHRGDRARLVLGWAG